MPMLDLAAYSRT